MNFRNRIPSVQEVLNCQTFKDFKLLLKDYGLDGVPQKAWRFELGDDAWWRIWKHVISLMEKENPREGRSRESKYA